MKKLRLLSLATMVLVLSMFSVLMFTACNGVSEDVTPARTGITATFTAPTNPMPHNTVLADLVAHITVVANYDNDTTQSIISVTLAMLSGTLTAGRVNTITVTVSGHSDTINVMLGTAPAVDPVRIGITATFAPPTDHMPHNATLVDLIPYLTVEANYSDYSTQPITPHADMLSIDYLSPNRINLVTVTVGGHEYTIRVRVAQPPYRTGITVTFTRDEPMPYNATLDCLYDYIKVIAYYSDGSTIPVPSTSEFLTLSGNLRAGQSNSINVTVNRFARNIAVVLSSLPARTAIRASFTREGLMPHNATLADLLPYIIIVIKYDNDTTVDFTAVTVDMLSGILMPNQANNITVMLGVLEDLIVVTLDAVAVFQTDITASFAPPVNPMPYNTTLEDLVEYITIEANFSDDSTQPIVPVTLQMLSGILLAGRANIITVTVGNFSDSITVTLAAETTIDPNSFVQMSIAANHALAVTAAGNLYIWGTGAQGNLGWAEFDRTSRPTPVRHPFFTNIRVAAVAAGGNNFSVVLTYEGFVYTWGNGSGGATGLGQSDIQETPMRVAGISNVTYISAGGSFVMAIVYGGYLYTWGANSDGQQALPWASPVTNNLVPVRLTVFSNVSLIAAGRNHAMAVAHGGFLYTWGVNTHGRLGRGHADADLANRFIPTRIANLANVTAITADEHSMAVANGGYLYTWGNNTSGILGHGHSVNSGAASSDNWSPLRVAGISNISKVSAAGFSMVVSQGHLYTWGAIGQGRLGHGIGNPASEGLQIRRVQNLSNVSVIASSGGRGMAIANNHDLYVWGQGGVALGLGLTPATNIGYPTILERS